MKLGKELGNNAKTVGIFLIFIIIVILVDKFFKGVNINAIVITGMVLYVLDGFRKDLFEYLESKKKDADAPDA